MTSMAWTFLLRSCWAWMVFVHLLRGASSHFILGRIIMRFSDRHCCRKPISWLLQGPKVALASCTKGQGPQEAVYGVKIGQYLTYCTDEELHVFLNQKLFQQTFAMWINGSRSLGAEFDVQGAFDLKSASAYFGWVFHNCKKRLSYHSTSIPLSRVATFRWALDFCLIHLHSLSLTLIIHNSIFNCECSNSLSMPGVQRNACENGSFGT